MRYAYLKKKIFAYLWPLWLKILRSSLAEIINEQWPGFAIIDIPALTTTAWRKGKIWTLNLTTSYVSIKIQTYGRIQVGFFLFRYKTHA